MMTGNLTMKTFIATLMAMALTLTSVARADVIGEFVFQGTVNGGSFDGTDFVGTQFDTYTFDITNNTTSNIDTIGISATDGITFTGDFLQAGGVSNKTTPTLDDDGFAGFGSIAPDAKEDDTFFVIPGNNPTAFGVTDTATELSASSFAAVGDALVPAQSTASIAFFSVPTGSPTPEGGFDAAALGFGQVVGRIIPEPATVGLLAMGGLLMVRRRRA